MTNKTERMLRMKEDDKLGIHRAIITVLRSLGQATSTEVHKDITKMYKYRRKLSNVNIDSRGIEIKDQRRNKGPVKRTIQRHLKQLCELGFVKQTGRLYTLSDSIKANRLFGSQFGATILDSLIPKPDYNLRTVKENLKSLIRLFGTIVIFCCMEAARPKKKHDAFNKESELMSTISWISSVINIPSVFHYFLFVFKNQIDDDMINELSKLTFHGIKKGKHIWTDQKTGRDYEDFPFAGKFPLFIDKERKPYNTGFYRDIPLQDEYLHLDKYHGVYTDYNPPLDEVSLKTYCRLVKALKELIPELDSKLDALRTNKDHSDYFLEGTR